MFFLLMAAVLIMLMLTSTVWLFVPYKDTLQLKQLPVWERAALYFVLYYPVLSFLIVLSPQQLIPDRVTNHAAYFIFCGCHALLSVCSASLALTLSKRKKAFLVLAVLSFIAGMFYVIGIGGALLG